MWRFDSKLRVSFGTRKRLVATVQHKVAKKPCHEPRTMMHEKTAPCTPVMAASATSSMRGLAAPAFGTVTVATPTQAMLRTPRMAAQVPEVPEMARRQPLGELPGRFTELTERRTCATPRKVWHPGPLPRQLSKKQQIRARRSSCWPMMLASTMGQAHSAHAAGVACSRKCLLHCWRSRRMPGSSFRRRSRSRE